VTPAHGWWDGFTDSLVEHGGALVETVLNVEGGEGMGLFLSDLEAIADIEAGLAPC
jgi:hypothetical protein